MTDAFLKHVTYISHLSRAIGEFDHSLCVLSCLFISPQQPKKQSSVVETLGGRTFTILLDLGIQFLDDLSVCERSIINKSVSSYLFIWGI